MKLYHNNKTKTINIFILNNATHTHSLWTLANWKLSTWWHLYLSPNFIEMESNNRSWAKHAILPRQIRHLHQTLGDVPFQATKNAFLN